MTLFETALDLADQAIPTFPCGPSKQPLTPNGFHDATIDPQRADYAVAALLGMPTGEASGYDVVDVDPLHGGDVWLTENRHRIPETRTVHTRSGGLHIYFRALPGMRCSTSRIADGVDVRAEGGYVILWQHAGLTVDNPDTLTEWPEWLATAASGPRARPVAAGAVLAPPPSVAAVVELLGGLPNPESATRDTYLRVMMAARGCCGQHDDPDIAEAAIQWAAKWPGSPGYDAEAEKWQSDFSQRDAPLAGWESLCAAATRLGVDVRPYISASEFDGIGVSPGTAAAPAARSAGNSHWRSKLLTNDKGTPLAVPANVMLALRESEECAGMLAFDTFKQVVMLMQSPPWHRGADVWAKREVEESDFIRCVEWLNAEGIKPSTGTAAEAMAAIAKDSPFHPVREYLHGLIWDGTPRGDTWLIDHLGTDDTPLNRAFSRRFLIAAVARIMRPGCQVDTMLVLEGVQGMKKSTALRALAGGEWFTDHIPDLSNKDASAQLQGIWILEHAELDALSRAESNKAKEFITRPVDRFRPSYGRVVVDFPRQCVFAGTVNPGGLGYLKDTTGNRRYWPVTCGVGWPAGRTVDTAALMAARNQLWAEATAHLASGETWWLESAGLQASQAAEAEKRLDSDIWHDAVAEIIEGLPHVTTSAILDDIRMRVPVKDRTKAMQMRVAGILRTLGWLPATIDGTRSYRAPAGALVKRAAIIPGDVDSVGALLH